MYIYYHHVYVPHSHTHTQTHTVPAGGKIEVTFPTSFSLAEVSRTEVSVVRNGSPFASPIAYPFTAAMRSSVNGTSLVASIYLGDIAQDAVLVRLINVRLQRFSGPTGVFGIRTLTGNNVTIDENRNVAGSVLQTAPFESVTITPAAPRAAPPGKYPAGARGRMLVQFRPSNPLPPDGLIAIVLPPGFDVRANSSVSVPVASTVPGSGAQGLGRTEWLSNASLNGALVTNVHSPTVVTIARVLATEPSAAGATVSFFIDAVKNPAYAGPVGTFQVRTLRRDGTPIDEHLRVPSDGQIIPGSFAGVCPPFCEPPRIRPMSKSAGKVTNLSIAFTPSVMIPYNAEIEIVLPAGSVSDTDSPEVLSDSILGGSNSVRALDGGFRTFASGRKIRIRRDGVGRDVVEGLLVSFTLVGVRNGLSEGFSGTYELRTRTAAGAVIEEKFGIEGFTILPNMFAAIDIKRSVYSAVSPSLFELIITPSVRIPVGGSIVIDFLYEIDDSSKSRDMRVGLAPGCVKECRCLPGTCLVPCCLNISHASLPNHMRFTATVLANQVVVYHNGTADLPALSQVRIAIVGLSNPPFEQNVTYKVESRTSSGARIDLGESSVRYTFGELSNVYMVPESFTASSVGNLVVGFTTSGPMPVDAKILVALPVTFVVPEFPTARSLTSSAIDGEFIVTRQRVGSTIMRNVAVITRRDAQRQVAGGSSIVMELRGVRVQNFSGTTGPFSVTTLTSDFGVINFGKVSELMALFCLRTLGKCCFCVKVLL